MYFNFTRQMIHMKNQALLSSKDKSKKLKCRLLQFLFGAGFSATKKKEEEERYGTPEETCAIFYFSGSYDLISRSHDLIRGTTYLVVPLAY